MSDQLVAEVEERAAGIAGMAPDALRSSSRALVGRGFADASAEALAMACEAIRRVTGSRPGDATVRCAAHALLKTTAAGVAAVDGRAATALAAYWHSLAGLGMHVVARDEVSARALRDYLTPIGELLDRPVGLVEPDTDRRAAYRAAITVGSYVEMACDYLRDNLHFEVFETVQRPLHAAVLDDTGSGWAVPHIDVAISAPRVDHVDVGDLPYRFGRRRDYQVYRKRSEIRFTRAGMNLLRSLVGWSRPPTAAEVTTAAGVETALAEGAKVSSGRQDLARITVQGYLRLYPAVACLSRHANLEELVAAGLPEPWQRRQLAFDQLLDLQRAEVYAYRQKVRELKEPLPELRALAAGHPEKLEGIERRTAEIGREVAGELARQVIVNVIDTEWRRHLTRTGFLDRQGHALYEPANMVEARAADATALYGACLSAIRDVSITYFLTLEFTVE